MLPVLTLIEHTLRGVTSKVTRDGPIIEAKGVVASFGSINRTDRTAVHLLKKGDGYLCVANVTYQPSVIFWIIFVLGFPVFSVIPVFFYLIQKSQVQEAIEAVLNRVSDEFDDDLPTLQPQATSVANEIEALEKLARLRDSGVITQAEFIAKKKKLLG